MTEINKMMTRAELLRGSFLQLADVAADFVEKRVEKMTPVEPRPPWALRETAFLSTCEQCGSCAKACPENLIRYHDETAGIAAGAPYLSFETNYCDFCKECVKACPSGALSQEEGHPHIGTAVIKESFCLPYTGTLCRSCYDVCPHKAITLLKNRYPAIDNEKCNGCGACVAHCMNRFGVELLSK